MEPSLTWKDNRRDVYLDGDLVGIYSTSYWNLGLTAGKNFGTSSQLRLALSMGQGDAKPDSQNEGLELPVYNNTDRDTVTAAYEIDTFDNHNMPHRGTRLKAAWQSSLEGLGADFVYDKASLSYTKASTFAGDHTLLFGLAGGITLDEDAPYFDQFQLGGLFKLSGLADQQLIGQNMVLGRAALLQESLQEPPRRLRPGDRGDLERPQRSRGRRPALGRGRVRGPRNLHGARLHRLRLHRG